MRKRNSVPERLDSSDVGDIPPEGDRQFVTALYRGLEILRSFQPTDEGLANQELCKRTGLGPSTVSRLTYTLTRLGYLNYDEDMGRYTLGVPVLDLGYSCLAGFGIRRVAQPFMQEMADQMGGGLLIALSVRDKMHMTYIACARSEGVMSLQLDVGSRIPIEISAAGHAYMSMASQEEFDRMMQDIHTVTDSDVFPKLASGIYDSIKAIKEQGYSVNLGQWRSEVNTVGVPFKLSHDDDRIYVMTCGGAAYLMSEERIKEEAAPMLMEMVREVSSRGCLR